MDFFPVLFVVPRVVGWLAHWRQMMLQDGGVKIWRPRQVRLGHPTFTNRNTRSYCNHHRYTLVKVSATTCQWTAAFPPRGSRRLRRPCHMEGKSEQCLPPRPISPPVRRITKRTMLATYKGKAKL